MFFSTALGFQSFRRSRTKTFSCGLLKETAAGDFERFILLEILNTTVHVWLVISSIQLSEHQKSKFSIRSSHILKPTADIRPSPLHFACRRNNGASKAYQILV